MCRLQSTHRGPFHPQGAGPPLAQQVPKMQRLPGAAGRQVLQQGRQCLLQGGLLQVSRTSAEQWCTILVAILVFCFHICLATLKQNSIQITDDERMMT